MVRHEGSWGRGAVQGEQRKDRGSARVATAAAMLACALGLFMGAPGAARGEGLRSITSVTGDFYFDGSYQLETDEVVLIRLLPAWTLEGKYAFTLTPNVMDNMVFLGPVVNFTDTIYAVLVGGLGLDATAGHNLLYEVDGSMNWETDLSSLFLSVKWNYFAVDGSWYVLPSIGGKTHILPALGTFGEFFFSYDSVGNTTGSFWAEVDYQLTSVVDILAGFTTTFELGSFSSGSSSQGIGYSIIAGAVVSVTRDLSVKYKLSYLSNVVQYQGQAATLSTGIENLVTLDWRM